MEDSQRDKWKTVREARGRQSERRYKDSQREERKSRPTHHVQQVGQIEEAGHVWVYLDGEVLQFDLGDRGVYRRPAAPPGSG